MGYGRYLSRYNSDACHGISSRRTSPQIPQETQVSKKLVNPLEAIYAAQQKVFVIFLFYFQLRLFNLLQKSTNVQNLCHHVTSCRGKEMSRKLKIVINIRTSGF